MYQIDLYYLTLVRWTQLSPSFPVGGAKGEIAGEFKYLKADSLSRVSLH
jgi:hypothetical protein